MPFVPHITVELEGAEELLKNLEGVYEELQGLKGRRLEDAWQELVDMVGREARDRAPHDLGNLLAGITEQIIQEEDEIIGLVFNDQFYAPFQERGTEEYFPNIDALEDWAERHDTSAWVVALAIAARGILPLKFFELSLTDNEDEILMKVGDVVAEIMEQEY